ncbi:sirohydrochlorin chelatase [Streptomyces sp. bgisy100]|uniref:sirohydrochlorin chelatase n=1 Tax=Streptomyces sp. bgisy100 TaxID=3413783 RepID=UPI003D72C884
MFRITAQLSSQLPHAGARSLRHPPPGDRRRPPALVAVAHGSRDPRALRTVRALLDRVRALRPEVPVRLGHIELNAPLLPDTLAALRGEAVLVPLLLGRGHHVKHDIPEALAAAAGLRARIAAPLGPHPLLAEALHGRLVEAGWPAAGATDSGHYPGGAAVIPGRHPGDSTAGPSKGTDADRTEPTGDRTEASRGAVVLAAAGSRDPDSAVDTAATAELLSARLGGVPVLPAYASAAGPTVPDAVAELRARGHERIAVASYYTAPGRFAARSAAEAPGVAAAPLGAHPAMARLLLHRYDEALATAPVRTVERRPAAA